MNLYAPSTHPTRQPMSGLGIGALSASGAQTAASLAATGATVTTSMLVALGTIGGPVGAAISGLIGIGMAVASMFKGCGQTCVAATEYANKAGDLMTQNRDHYLALPTPRYRSIQLAALNNFDTTAAALNAACGQPGLGPAGQRCISERLVKGGTAPWCPTPDHRGCDWVTVLRDPIANDPNVIDDPVLSSTGSVIDAVTGGIAAGGDGYALLSSPLILLVGGGLMLYAIGSEL